MAGAPGEIRTPDPQIRSLVLYAIILLSLSASIVGAHTAERQTTFGNCNDTQVIPAPLRRVLDWQLQLLSLIAHLVTTAAHVSPYSLDLRPMPRGSPDCECNCRAQVRGPAAREQDLLDGIERSLT